MSSERSRGWTRSNAVRLAGVVLLAAVAFGAFSLHRRSVRRRAPDLQWSIGIWEGPSPVKLGPASGVANPVMSARDVTDVAAEFVADPFMVRRGSTWYLFFEVMEKDTHRGLVAVATSPDGRSWTYGRIVLREPFHLSYPYVFEDGSDVYMVPETYEAGAVRLYRAVNFPYDWKLERTLLSGKPFVDSSLVKYRGRWWMFTSTPENNELLLYFAASLEGPWVAHPKSPVVRETRGSRGPADGSSRWKIT